jgi:hypothetical protein
VRFADRLLRQGHVSEQAIIEAVMGGERPDHLNRCATCAERAFELGRWLEQTRGEALAEADAAFPPERLAIQQNQILRRIAQIEEPVRVIEFPRQHVAVPAGTAVRRVSPAWLGVAAAAGLVVGVVGGHFSAHVEQPAAPASATAIPGPASDVGGDLAAGGPQEALDAEQSATPARGLFDLDLDGAVPPWLQPLDENTPRLTQVALN